jgi:hypothetical protein
MIGPSLIFDLRSLNAEGISLDGFIHLDYYFMNIRCHGENEWQICKSKELITNCMMN